jgi:hypothetical protein
LEPHSGEPCADLARRSIEPKITIDALIASGKIGDVDPK